MGRRGVQIPAPLALSCNTFHCCLTVLVTNGDMGDVEDLFSLETKKEDQSVFKSGIEELD